MEVQIIWAVLSAFKKEPKEIGELIPFADGNSELWKGSPKPQLKSAIFEIVCWDSSSTLFIGVSDEIGKDLILSYPDIKKIEMI